MKIGVLSDTHLHAPGLSAKKLTTKLLYTVHTSLGQLLELVKPHFQGVDLILHAGDAVDPVVHEILAGLAPLRAVAGNMDGPAIKARWPEQDQIEIGGKKIGLIHGWGAPDGLELKVKAKFPEGMDAVVFGHSHRPYSQRLGPTLLFNPGSPTDRRWSPYRTLGILHLEAAVRGEIIRLE